MGRQPDLFGEPPPFPPGFRYQPDVFGPEEESRLLHELSGLPFREFEFQGYLGKRRVVSYGWLYDFNDRAFRRTEAMPSFILSVRDLAARFAGRPGTEFEHVLVTEYAPGAGIGWHRDKGVFGDVVGVSLLSPCRFRLRRRLGHRWERAALRLEPRSAYLLTGPARTEWEHSIPEAEALRYSLTFRTLRTPSLQSREEPLPESDC